MMKQHQAFQTAQQEMAEAMQRERRAMTAQTEEMQQHMKKQNHQELSDQRQSNLVELIAMKRSLDARCAETIATKTAELEAARTALENAIADEKKARVQREQEHMLHFLTRMEEFEKNKAAQLETAKQHFDAECKHRLEELDQMEEQRRAKCARRMEELDQMEERRRVQCARRMEELDVHAAELKAEERLRFERELESLNSKHLARMEELNQAKADAARDLEAARRELEQERTQLHATAQQTLQSELESQNSKHLARMEELNQAKADAARQLEAARRELDAATRQLEEERTKMRAELESQNSKHLARMEELNQAKADAARQLEAARRELEEEHTKMRAAAQQTLQSELESQNSKHLARMEELNKAKADAARQLDAARRELEQERTQLHATAKQTLQSELESQNSKHLARMEELNQAKTQFEAARRQLEEERTQLHATAKQTLQSELESQNSKHLARMEELNQAKTQYEAARRQLEEERTQLREAADQRFEAHVQKHAMKMMQAISFSHVSRAVSANYAHMHMICHQLDFNEKRVLIYSHYSGREEVESYNYLTLERMEHRFDHVIVLTNCPNQWQFASPDYNKFHVLCYNFKSDFRNYGVFIMQAGGQLKRASQVCIMNDSFVVVDVAAFDRCMHGMFAQACDFTGITSSYENVYHIQSYFMCFNNAATMGAVVDYFDAHGLPMNHHAAISLYELGITRHLVNKGFVPFAAVSNKEMPIPLNTTHCKWSQVLQTTGIVKRQHFLKQYPARFAMTDLNIALVANKFSENKHFIHFLTYHGIKWD
jgi:hypothetical protein